MYWLVPGLGHRGNAASTACSAGHGPAAWVLWTQPEPQRVSTLLCFGFAAPLGSYCVVLDLLKWRISDCLLQVLDFGQVRFETWDSWQCVSSWWSSWKLRRLYNYLFSSSRTQACACAGRRLLLTGSDGRLYKGLVPPTPEQVNITLQWVFQFLWVQILGLHLYIWIHSVLWFLIVFIQGANSTLSLNSMPRSKSPTKQPYNTGTM